MTENDAAPQHQGIENQVGMNLQEASLLSAIDGMKDTLRSIESYQRLAVILSLVRELGRNGDISIQEAEDIQWFLSDAFTRQARAKRWERG